MEGIVVSFSGGRTSAYMLWVLLTAGVKIAVVVFANTGLEDERTLIFVNRVAQEFGVLVVWLEAVIHEKRGVASTHRIVSFETASRLGEPYEEMCRVYGIPNVSYLHCTRELKANPIRSYLREMDLQHCDMAIGIRADEPARINPPMGPLKRNEIRKVYPLWLDFPTTKAMVTDFWEEQNFDLGLMEHEGNCITCFKKSDGKLFRLAHENRAAFDFMARMERQHGLAGHNVDGTPRVFFRKHRSTQNILAIADILKPRQNYNYAEENSGCSESCEAF